MPPSQRFVPIIHKSSPLRAEDAPSPALHACRWLGISLQMRAQCLMELGRDTEAAEAAMDATVLDPAWPQASEVFNLLKPYCCL